MNRWPNGYPEGARFLSWLAISGLLIVLVSMVSDGLLRAVLVFLATLPAVRGAALFGAHIKERTEGLRVTRERNDG